MSQSAACRTGVATFSAMMAAAGIAAPAWAQYTTPPSYTMPNAPTQVRAGTVAAIADNTNRADVYGSAVTFGRAAGASYAGIGTTVMGATTAVVGTTTPLPGTGLPYFGSSAWLRAGLASSATTVSMSWRTATQAEFYGSSVGTTANPGPMPDSGPWNTLGSDVLHLTGISAVGALDANGRLPTDAYTLELTFDPNIIVAGYQNYSTLGWTAHDIISRGELQLASFNTVAGVWRKGIDVIHQGASFRENYLGTSDAFAAQYGATDANLSTFVGSWGVVLDDANPTNSRIWAVMDHTSLYSVVPAPGAAALIGAVGLLGSRRRKV